MNPNGMRMKLPAEQMSETSAKADVLTGPVAEGSRADGADGTVAGSATVVRCALAVDAAATGAAVPGLGTVNWF
jgi:hypothetical protein